MKRMRQNFHRANLKLVPATAIWTLLCLVGLHTEISAQQGEAPLRLFGYFQTNYVQYNQLEEGFKDAKTFSMQQLNLFMQKDLDRDLTAFVNFEFLNNYSSSKQWGSFSVEEAWIRYHVGTGLNLRLGLQTPTFNYLNEIKNRTPLMPYVIRPLVYESSFNEILRLEEYLPSRAYVQVFGYLPKGGAKLDYALYVGNSPNINSDRSYGQTGVDTTNTFLVGGRVGLRAREFNIGFSATYDKFDFPQTVVTLLKDDDVVSRVPRVRIGGDLRYAIGDFALESEFIKVNYEQGLGKYDIDLQFYYATLFYDVTDNIRIYGSYWLAKERFFRAEEIEGVFGSIDTVTADSDYKLATPTFGGAYTVTDKIVIKVQVAPVRQDYHFEGSEVEYRFNYFAAAISVFL